MLADVLFWFLLCIIGYTYFFYAGVLFVLRKLWKKSHGDISKTLPESELPAITLFIAAYNEKAFVDKKVKNTREIDYPGHLLKQVWVTDGSNDGTPDMLSAYQDIEVYHLPSRNGKIAAMNRGMKFVSTPIVVFSDANTYIGQQSLRYIAAKFMDTDVGCVAGEKRIVQHSHDNAVTSGEGLYWRYESFIKSCESDLNSVVGAAGELFAIRTRLYEPLAPDTILDDFVLSFKIADKGYKIKYCDKAYATEFASINTAEEMKRKIRIATGAFQAFFRLRQFLNPVKYGFLTFEYVSHKVFRWIIVPFAIPVLFLLNVVLVAKYGFFHFYAFIFIIQVLFYITGFFGYMLEQKTIRYKWIFAPYYLIVMNFCIYMGFWRFVTGNIEVSWDRVMRSEN